MTEPRKTPLIDDRYMALAWIYAGFSKDPNTQVGAQIIGENNYPLGAGYNGPPRKMDDNKIPWHRPSADNPEEYCKYDVTTHAERNAIRHTNRLGSGKSLIGSTLYITALPCPPMRFVAWAIAASGLMPLRASSPALRNPLANGAKISLNCLPIQAPP